MGWLPYLYQWLLGTFQNMLAAFIRKIYYIYFSVITMAVIPSFFSNYTIRGKFDNTSIFPVVSSRWKLLHRSDDNK